MGINMKKKLNSSTLHGNTVIKRSLSVTPQHDGAVKKLIETLFASGRFTQEEIRIYSVKKTFYKM